MIYVATIKTDKKKRAGNIKMPDLSQGGVDKEFARGRLDLSLEGKDLR